jgi:hypothetical protein
MRTKAADFPVEADATPFCSSTRRAAEAVIIGAA